MTRASMIDFLLSSATDAGAESADLERLRRELDGKDDSEIKKMHAAASVVLRDVAGADAIGAF